MSVRFQKFVHLGNVQQSKRKEYPQKCLVFIEAESVSRKKSYATTEYYLNDSNRFYNMNANGNSLSER